jgi:hypothetical protein
MCFFPTSMIFLVALIDLDPIYSADEKHLGAARRPVTEVAAIGDDVDLRHRHRHAAGQTRNAEQEHQHVGRNAKIARGAGSRRL